ncbi:MAG: hypothetical protein AAF614_03355 [Chloroflexota bacterium]
MSVIQTEDFTKALLALLEETFESANGYYLDGGDTLFETLAEISAAEASIPVGGKCATLAAQVRHTSLYLDVIETAVRTQAFPQVDWNDIWQNVREVTPDEWEAAKAELRTNYERVVELIKNTSVWPWQAMGGAMGVIAHSAYHLGEIRQALCTLKA